MIKVSQPKLNDIENKLYRLWTNRQERAAFIEGGKGAEQKDDSDSVDNFTKSIDGKGVMLYSSLIELGRVDLMSSIFPVLKDLVGKQFKTLVLDYFEQLPPNHYNLNQSASRFAEYLRTVEKLNGRYPFISELADYEWIELAVLEDDSHNLMRSDSKVMAESSADPARFAGLKPVLNCAFIARHYNYPVPRLLAEIQAGQKLPRRFKQEPTYVVVYRDPDTLDARFLEVGEVAYRMLENVKNNPHTTYGELITAACSAESAGKNKDVQALLTGCLEAIDQFKNLAIIVAEI